MGYTAAMMQFASLYAQTEALLGARLFKIVRYLISGGTAAAANLLALFLLVHFGRMHYLYASVLAFALSIGVSFTMQKFWTFRDTPLHDMHMQFARYLVIIGFNLFLNTALVYLFVEKAGMWYMFAQILTTAIIAALGYFGYRHVVFRARP